MKPSILLATAVLLVINSTARAQGEDLFQACLIETMSKADSSTTVGELRKTCEEEVKVKKLETRTIVLDSSDAAASKRLREEAVTEEQPFVITPYLPNYVLFAAYNASDPNVEPYREAFGDPDYELDDVELKFQLSLKVPLAHSLIGNNYGD